MNSTRAVAYNITKGLQKLYPKERIKHDNLQEFDARYVDQVAFDGEIFTIPQFVEQKLQHPTYINQFKRKVTHKELPAHIAVHITVSNKVGLFKQNNNIEGILLYYEIKNPFTRYFNQDEIIALHEEMSYDIAIVQKEDRSTFATIYKEYNPKTVDTKIVPQVYFFSDKIKRI